MNWTHLLFDPKGRIGQKDYWIGVAVLIGGNIVAGILPVIGFLLSLGLIWVGAAVYGKRLHDAGKTAWLHAIPWGLNVLTWILAFMMFGAALVPLIMTGVTGGEPTDAEAFALVGSAFGAFGVLSLGLLVWAGYTIWVGVLTPDAGANPYGPAPVIEGQARPAAAPTETDVATDA